MCLAYQSGKKNNNTSDDALYARCSFRKKSIAKAESEAPRDSDGNMICPTCGKVIPKSIIIDTKNGPMTRRGYDLDHYPLTWDERKKIMKASGIRYTRKQVLDEYNSDLRVQCPPCNQGHLYEGVEGEFANGKK
ncbi:MAG: filamentous hemagglutinin [Lachnospiraceae bacterium]|nr:filamentous hemagglutinin [Lachnospiraceae bacterium]